MEWIQCCFYVLRLRRELPRLSDGRFPRALGERVHPGRAEDLQGKSPILVEKVIGATAELDSAMVERYYGLKSEHGYSADSIERKRMSLEGVLVPVTAKWNEDILRGSGFEHVDCFWRWMNFAGWIAVKE